MGLLDNILNTVNEGIGKAVEKVNAAAQEANAKAEAEGKAPLTEEEKEAIFYQNAARTLGLPASPTA